MYSIFQNIILIKVDFPTDPRKLHSNDDLNVSRFPLITFVFVDINLI